LWTIRFRIASPRVGVTSCQDATGSWLVISTEPRRGERMTQNQGPLQKAPFEGRYPDGPSRELEAPLPGKRQPIDAKGSREQNSKFILLI
jgi:hypothetical protein